ncbi:hypothetical protein [Sulfuricurvum sp.]|uniref:hypothetical protein n=1 Tax=Sulfuricurvum sp. TaxID=2025608 RepID=UPI00199031AC|nr:hypothetical protein [Sulfuricurvum sp.]MBD3807055.1 hypothetical protein [Sulfuricurvum sp.]
MCGIVGYIGLENQKRLDDEIFVKMNDIMEHREYFNKNTDMFDEKFLNRLYASKDGGGECGIFSILLLGGMNT